MKIELKRGRKNEFGTDMMIYITARNEAITFSDILKILKFFFENEDRIYPPAKGFKGRGMLVNAIYDLAHGMTIEEIKENYKLKVRNGQSELFLK